MYIDESRILMMKLNKVHDQIRKYGVVLGPTEKYRSCVSV